ncbi:hypothetical protein ACX27_17505 [Nostoc piscinale CENA21]|uniref:Uncharacterized protein n=1 Tax=Nostoc piscinale CENA21 TaxID=224013 RepID=A0A0M4T5H1_9NOSO|nr:hypothetical protein [Nostoc piscinale]ALF54229.1 hypothetical protein ACX27_17505 [Nostoc piscinale CENA21]
MSELVLVRAGGLCFYSRASALGRQRRGEAVRSWGFPPGGTAERVSHASRYNGGNLPSGSQFLQVGKAAQRTAHRNALARLEATVVGFADSLTGVRIPFVGDSATTEQNLVI